MPNALRVAVLSDTHVAPSRTLPDEVWAELATAQAILHAGDVVSAHLLDELAEVAPVHAVLGNNDTGLDGTLPERLEIDLVGVAVALVHDPGARAGRPARLRRWFPHADLVVFGHSHEPVDEVGQDGQRLFNPGSPTQRRRQPRRTMGWLELADGRVVSHAVVPVGPPP